MPDLDKQKLPLATIAVCAVFMCGLVFWATQGYDSILSKQVDTDAKIDQVIKGQEDTHQWLESISQRVDANTAQLHEHETQISAIQASINDSAAQNAVSARREKNFEEGKLPQN